MRALLLLLVTTTACAQTPARNTLEPGSRPDLYVCEGCEAIHEHSFEGLTARTTVPPPDEPGEALVLSGRVFGADGVTPKAGIVLYAYHTNAAGHYPAAEGATGWARRHGYLRGWVKTDSEGFYEITTIRPGAYPDAASPAHIHLVVKEPGRQEYWIDEVVFADDPRLTAAFRGGLENRGGSGIVTLRRGADGIWRGVRDILLEP